MGRPKKPCAHLFISPATCSATFSEHGIAMDGQLEVALVVQRHGRDLAERVLAVEHPAVGARQQRVRDVADAVFHRRIRLRRGTGALNPLALEVLGNLGADESAGAGVLNLDLGSPDGGLRVEESDPLLVSSPRRPPLDASRHHGFPIGIQTSQGFQSSHGFRGENVRVGVLEVASDFQLSRCHESPFATQSRNCLFSKTAADSRGP